MAKSNSAVTSGNSIFFTLQIIFITFKLVPGTDIYNWSWWTVLIPSFIVLGLVCLVMFLALFLMIGERE